MTFNAAQVAQQAEADRPSGPLPAGIYNAIVEGYTNKTSQAGHQYVSVTFKVKGPGGSGKAWGNYNVNHPNDQPRNIAMGEIARLCVACGWNSINDVNNPNEIVGCTLNLELAIDGSYNRIRDYHAFAQMGGQQTGINGMAQAQQAHVNQTQQMQQPGGPGATFEDDSIPF